MHMKRINFYVEDSMYEILKEAPGTITENLRNAIREYIEKLRLFSASESKRKEV
jgi:hypothetical protein